MRIIIIGGEAAGMSAAAKARRLIKEAEIVVYEASEVISFGACGLPYFVGDEFQDPSYMAEFTPEEFAAKGIEVKINHRVLNIDPKSQTLEVEHQGQRICDRYDRLLVATGATEAIPPIQGLDLDGLFTLRRMSDGIALKAAVSDAHNQEIVVIGSGYIGLELVEALVHQGKRVRLIERAAQIIPEAFDAEISQHIEQELREQGVTLHLNESVTAITGEGRLSGVQTTQGHYAADLVILCTGVKPNTEFLSATGIKRLQNGAIEVDREGRTSLPNVWAAGDCASVWHSVKQQQVYLPLATVANKLGRMVGENLAGEHKEFPGMLGSAALKILSLEAGRTGLGEKEAQELGIDYRTLVIKDKCHTNYCAGQSDIHIKLIYAAGSKRILGGQIVGRKGAVHRVDALAVAVTMGVTTEQLGMLDFAYAPPFSRTWDLLNVAGNVAK